MDSATTLRDSPTSRITRSASVRPDSLLAAPSSGPSEDLAQLRGEGNGIAGLAVLVTEEAAVAAREDHELRLEPLGDGERAAERHLALS